MTTVFTEKGRFRFITAVVVVVLFLDQLTKYLARVYLKPVHSIPVLGNFFRLTYVENTGIAFGVRVENKVFFTLLSLVAVVIIFYYLFALRDNRWMTLSFAAILGGALGNLFDRFVHGYVVDFLDFDFFDMNLPSFKFFIFRFEGYTMQRWPVFNVADMAVFLGMLTVLLMAFFHKAETGDSVNDPTSNNNSQN